MDEHVPERVMVPLTLQNILDLIGADQPEGLLVVAQVEGPTNPYFVVDVEAGPAPDGERMVVLTLSHAGNWNKERTHKVRRRAESEPVDPWRGPE